MTEPSPGLICASDQDLARDLTEPAPKRLDRLKSVLSGLHAPQPQ